MTFLHLLSVAAALIAITNAASSPNSWIGKSLNESRLDLYLFVLGIIGFINFILFVVFSKRYQFVDPPSIDEAVCQLFLKPQ
jgi:hypothetical protein